MNPARGLAQELLTNFVLGHLMEAHRNYVGGWQHLVALENRLITLIAAGLEQEHRVQERSTRDMLDDPLRHVTEQVEHDEETIVVARKTRWVAREWVEALTGGIEDGPFSDPWHAKDIHGHAESGDVCAAAVVRVLTRHVPGYQWSEDQFDEVARLCIGTFGEPVNVGEQYIEDHYPGLGTDGIADFDEGIYTWIGLKVIANAPENQLWVTCGQTDVESVIETVDGCGMLHVFDWTKINEIPAV